MTAAAARIEPTDDAPLLIARDGPVLLVGLNRPRKRNALNDAAIQALEACFAAIGPEVGAAVIHGVGPCFSAGLDLAELAERDLAEGMAHSRLWHRAFERIEFGPVPVVAALHGAVVGGGLELAAAAHIRVAARDAAYALPEGQRGIFVGGGGSVRLPRLIGTARMADMMLTGRSYGAEEGAALGFSQYVVDAGQALETALGLAHRIAANAPMTNYAVIHALPHIAAAPAAVGYAFERVMSAAAQSAPEAKARVRDFLEKRAAKALPT